MRHFFAYLSRMRLIRRWGLMRNTYEENIQEHSLQVAMIAHGLAVIRNTCFNGCINADRVTTLATYHEAGEVFTGDLATPIKYFNPEIKKPIRPLRNLPKAAWPVCCRLSFSQRMGRCCFLRKKTGNCGRS